MPVARGAALRRLSARLVPRRVLLLLRLDDLAQPVDVGRHYAQRHSPHKALLPMGPHPLESAMVQIVDRRLNRRMLPTRLRKIRGRAWSAFEWPPFFGIAASVSMLSNLVRLPGDQ